MARQVETNGQKEDIGMFNRITSFSAVLMGLFVMAFLNSCDSGTSANANGTAIVKMKADFAANVLPKPSYAVMRSKLVSCPSVTATMDTPQYDAGMDCDADGGVIQYLTPQSFKIALKRLTFIKDNQPFHIISDTGTLAQAVVYDLSTVLTLPEKALPAGNYTGVEAEIYYYEITMPINDPSSNTTIRIYLSDDDFPAEGSLGHHQGDITLVNGSGVELGWVGVAVPWTTGNLQTNPSSINRPGSTDGETGHQRGLYGNAQMWDQSQFSQGTGMDIYLLSAQFQMTISGNSSSAVTFTFPVKDSWFFEDFDNDQLFDPCQNTSDACAGNAEWSPIFVGPEISYM